MKQLFLAITLLMVSLQLAAQTNQAKEVESSQVFGDYRVQFSVFNSTFISPEIAQTYQLTRGNDRVLINISVTNTSDGQINLGLPATVTATATNLLQQQRTLDFKTINEGEATYYIADLRHTHEEDINFSVNVQPNGVAQAFTVRFTRKLYINE